MESTGKENTPIIFTHKINPKVLIIFTYKTSTPTLGPHSCIIHVEVWDFRKAAPWQVVESFRTDLKCKLRTLLILKCFAILWFYMYLHYLQDFQLLKFCFQGISFMCPYAIPDHMCILIAIVFNNWSYAFSDSPTIVLYFQDKCALWKFYAGKIWI